MTTPSETFDYDMRARTRVLRKRQEVPSGHDASAYVTRRLLAPAADGETVPVSLVYHRDTPLDGSAPVLLYGYGSYGHSLPASFSTARLSLVDRGFIYAIAHVRGGMEKGYRWYRTGKREFKANTFADFIAAAEHLIAQGLTAKGRIVAQGGSAGGMLMGAIANMRPDLFAGILAEVPFVDVVNTMLDDTLPLTPPEWLEWGNPSPTPRPSAGCSPIRPMTTSRRRPIRRSWRSPGLRPARHLLGAGEMGGAAARRQDGRQSRPAADQHGCGPWRRRGVSTGWRRSPGPMPSPWR